MDGKKTVNVHRGRFYPSLSMLIMSKLTTSKTFMAWSSPTEQNSAPSALTEIPSITPTCQKQRLIIYKYYFYIFSERETHYQWMNLDVLWVTEKWLVWCCSCFRRFAERLLTDVITGHLPKWLRKCLTNSTPSSSFFFQNFTCPSWLAVMIKSVLGW